MSSMYAYKVRDGAGQVVTGSLEANDTLLVANKLRQMGYVPISIRKQSKLSISSDVNIPGLSNRVKLKELAIFSRQFATMINAGLTLLRSLSILVSQTDSKFFARVLDEVRAEVESGSSLSEAMAKHPKVFGELFVALIRAGESGGNLDRTLMDLANTIEKQVELRGKIRSAMAYPVAVLSLVGVILIAMLVIIVPIFKKMYKQLGGTLPLPTRLLITVSNLAVIGVPLFIVLSIVGLFLYRKWTARPAGRYIVDRLKLKIPIVGGLVRKTSMARFASTLSTLLGSGVPILESLDITSVTVGNSVVSRGVEAIAAGTRRGEPMHKALVDHPVFPPMLVQMMAVGEETGAIDDLLAKVATFYNQQVNATVDALTSLLEPLLIAVLGTVVGSMVVSLYLPMFNIIKLVQ